MGIVMHSELNWTLFRFRLTLYRKGHNGVSFYPLVIDVGKGHFVLELLAVAHEGGPSRALFEFGAQSNWTEEDIVVTRWLSIFWLRWILRRG